VPSVGGEGDDRFLALRIAELDLLSTWVG